MSQLVDDLKAARALIDTPEKFKAVGSVRSAVDDVCGGEAKRETAAFVAILNVPGTGRPWVHHAEVMDRIDRAIAAASPPLPSDMSREGE